MPGVMEVRSRGDPKPSLSHRLKETKSPLPMDASRARKRCRYARVGRPDCVMMNDDSKENSGREGEAQPE